MADIKAYALSGIDYTAGQQTGYILVKGSDALLVDASADLKDIRDVLTLTHTALRAVLITHCHFDHVANGQRIQTAYPDAPFYASPLTQGFLEDDTWTAGFVRYPTPKWHVDVAVEEKVYTLGAFRVRVLYTPGHTADSVCYLVDDAILLGGDTVMNEWACGTVALPTGDVVAMRATARKLWDEVPPTAFILGGHVWRSGDDFELYRLRSTVAGAKKRNMINNL